MKVSQLQPGHEVHEHKDNGEVDRFTVLQVAPAGRMVEVTFDTKGGRESAIYPAEAYLNAANG
ncbi:hypothetical protein GZH52_02860 [Crenobacter sp. HX-7-9]|uniref:Uncharacterized protein n=2 Tax=Crenobacter TaxID=1654931 RepID=A0A4T0UTB6_9NEIS|nr:hypothetical protein [Crenobacter caeni]TIC82174.1 hypothetical protein E5K04_10275 [Crenobacter intestini]